MKVSGLNIAVAREVAIIALCLLLGFTSSAFAGGENDKKTKRALSVDEIELFAKLDSEYQHNLEEILEDFEHPPATFNRVEIYDMEGNLLKGFDLKNEKFNEQMLLPHALHVLTDNNVAVYMVL